MPFTITNSNNEKLKVAGLASVATSNNYRKRGIANKLCNLARDWAKENNFDYFGTTLTVSPHKNAEMINKIGEQLEKIE